MGMTDAIARSAVRHAHVLVVEVPGYWLTRVAVERHVLARCWRLAASPADADVLAVCGTPGAELTQLVTRLWDQMPGPRSRVHVASPDAVLPALATAEDELLDWARQRADSRDRPDAHPSGSERDEKSTANHVATASGHGESGPHADHDAPEPAPHANRDQHPGHDQHGGMRHGQHAGRDDRTTGEDVASHGGTDPATQTGHDMHGGPSHGGHTGDGAMKHGDIDHAGMGHGAMSHADMGHEGMEMAPAGIPLARGGEDRDGLELDALHMQLGPVLAYWPAGLILRCTLQGDVIVDAEARLIDADVAPAHDPVPFDQFHRAARRCDNAMNLLALAGWTDAASRARRIRDALLSGHEVDRAAADVDGLCRSVRRSWLLRWSLRRLRYLTDHDLAHHGLPAHLLGDTRDRMLAMLQQAVTILAGTAGELGAGHTSPTPVGSIPELVRGLDLAAARLVVASLDLDALSAHGEVSRV